MKHRNAHEVIVVGGGAAGLMQAGLLSDHGFDVALVAPNDVEVNAQGPWRARTVALTPSSVALLDQLGFDWEHWRHCRYRTVGIEDADAPVRLRFSAAELGHDFLGVLIELQLLNAGLAKCVYARGLPVYRYPAFHLHADRRLELGDGTVLEGQLLIATDGAQSWLRQQTDIHQSILDYGQSALVAVVETDCPHQARAWQKFSDGYPLAFLPLGNAESCAYAVVWSLPTPRAQALLQSSPAAFLLVLQRHMADELGQAVAVYDQELYPLVARHALRYYDGNVVLVGDSAHTIHPLAGQGLNLGLTDIRVLVEELMRARRRGLSLQHSSVLGRYQRRRRGDNALMQGSMTILQRLMAEHQPLWSIVRGQGWAWIERQPWLKGWMAEWAVR